MLKVFWLNKPKEEKYVSLFRGSKEPENITKVHIKEDFPFRHLTINNTRNNRYILLLQSLTLKVNTENSIRLFMSDNLLLEEQLKEEDYVRIGHELNLNKGSSLTELYSAQASPKTLTDLLPEHYVLLVPGGSLIIEMEKEVYEVDIVFSSTIEEF